MREDLVTTQIPVSPGRWNSRRSTKARIEKVFSSTIPRCFITRWQRPGKPIQSLVNPPLSQLCARLVLIPFTSFLSVATGKNRPANVASQFLMRMEFWRKLAIPLTCILSRIFSSSCSNWTCHHSLSISSFSLARMAEFQSSDRNGW